MKGLSEPRLLAQIKGQRTYIPQTPCSQGHRERYVVSRRCVECTRLHNTKRVYPGLEEMREYRRANGEVLAIIGNPT